MHYDLVALLHFQLQVLRQHVKVKQHISLCGIIKFVLDHNMSHLILKFQIAMFELSF